MNLDSLMNVFFLFTGSGSLVILTSCSSVENPALLRRLGAEGIERFLAYQVPIKLAKERYGTHFDIVAAELAESDDLQTRIRQFPIRKRFFAIVTKPILLPIAPAWS